MIIKTEATKAEGAKTYTSDGYQYRVEGDYAVIIGYTGESAWAIIPESLDGYEVCEIGDSAFAKNRRVEAVTVPKTVVCVGERAFSNMENLNNVTLKKPDSQTAEQEIGEYAFASCPNLIAVALPANVRQIAKNAFLGAEKNPEPTWDHREFHICTEESAAYVLGYAEENHYKVTTNPYYKVVALRKVSGKNVKSKASVIKGKRVEAPAQDAESFCEFYCQREWTFV